MPYLMIEDKDEGYKLTEPAFGIFLNFESPLPANFCDSIIANNSKESLFNLEVSDH